MFYLFLFTILIVVKARDQPIIDGIFFEENYNAQEMPQTINGEPLQVNVPTHYKLALFAYNYQ